MRDFSLYGDESSSETQAEQRAIRSYNHFAEWRVRQVDFLGNGRPKPITRRLEFRDHLPVSIGIYPFHCESTLVKVNQLQDMLIQVGFALRDMRRRLARREGEDDGKFRYLDAHYQKFVHYLGLMWEHLTTPGRLELGTRDAGILVKAVEITEEMAEFVREMDVDGVEFRSEEWNLHAEIWAEMLMEDEDWLREGNWRERFCGMMQGTAEF